MKDELKQVMGLFSLFLVTVSIDMALGVAVIHHPKDMET